MLKLTHHESGLPVWVRAKHIVTIARKDGVTWVSFVDGCDMLFTETPAKILAMMPKELEF